MEIEFVVANPATFSPADAIVIPAGVDLRVIAGVGATLRKAGGPAVQEGVVERAPAPLGSVVVGPGGDLATPHVLHAVVVSHRLEDLLGPREEGALIHGSVLRAAMREALLTAERLNVRALAVTDLTGPAAFPEELGARIALSELRAYRDAGAPTPIERVTFVALDDDRRDILRDAWGVLEQLHAEHARDSLSAPAPGDPFAAGCVAFERTPRT
jgi:O-acetyl-ADP-ribose deacetylase (regulator of RNase III)